MTEQPNKRKDKTGIFANTINQLVVLVLKVLGKLPFSLLYILSDFLYFIIRYLIAYRSDVIKENIKRAFPDKSDTQIVQLRNRFYKYFCDVFIETMKLYQMSAKEMEQHVSFKGLDELNRFAENGKSVIVLAYHHQNWDWGSYLQTLATHKVLMVYNKMRRNKPMDDFLLHAREKWGGQAVQMGRAAKMAFDLEKKEIPTLLWLVADQSALPDQGMWALFFGHEAAFFSGPEKIARKYNQAVFFQRVRRISRGKYEYEFTLMIEEPLKANPGDILLKYIHNMEKAIKENPEYYLWSHKRWKHKRPGEYQLIQ